MHFEHTFRKRAARPRRLDAASVQEYNTGTHSQVAREMRGRGVLVYGPALCSKYLLVVPFAVPPVPMLWRCAERSPPVALGDVRVDARGVDSHTGFARPSSRPCSRARFPPLPPPPPEDISIDAARFMAPAPGARPSPRSRYSNCRQKVPSRVFLLPDAMLRRGQLESLRLARCAGYHKRP